MLDDQLDHLGSTCSRFDAGDTREYCRIAVVVRVLFHNTRNSNSLIRQAGMEDRRFVNSARLLRTNNMLSECNLIVLRSGPNSRRFRWAAGLDDGPLEFVDFNTWWRQPVMSDQVHAPLTRADLALYVADQDGGAHVDPSIDAAFNKIRSDGFLWGDEQVVADHPERHAIRQIGHEVLKSLRPSYRRQSKEIKGHYIRGSALQKGGGTDDADIVGYHTTDPTDDCPCQSGLRYGECHRRGALAPLQTRSLDDVLTAPPGAKSMRFGFVLERGQSPVFPMKKMTAG